jgi:hypothetical protein
MDNNNHWKRKEKKHQQAAKVMIRGGGKEKERDGAFPPFWLYPSTWIVDRAANNLLIGTIWQR